MLYFFLTWLAAPLLRWRAGRHAGPPRRILLIQTAKIGDWVCTTPIVASLRASWPECHMTVLINPVCEPLLKHEPAIDAIWPISAGEWRGPAGKLRLWRRLRRGRFDHCIVLSPNVAFFILPLWAGIPRRAAILPNFISGSLERCVRFLTDSERHRSGHLVLDTELALLQRLGCRQLLRRKSLPNPAEATAHVAAWLTGRRAPRLGLGVSSGNKLKALSAEQLARLCRRLLDALPHDLVLIGTAEDRANAAEIRGRCGDTLRLIDATGVFALDELPALLSALDGYFGVDSGVTYIADAVDLPTLDLHGPANPDDQRPTGARAISIAAELPCAPCAHVFRAPYHCQRGDRACVSQVNLDHLAGRLQALLEPPA